MKIVIADYGLGNLKSIENIIHKAGGDAHICANPEVIARGEKIILPGVGAFDKGVTALAETGIKDALLFAASQGANILGICLGMQLLMNSSEEGSLPGLGLVPGKVIKFPRDSSYKIPHMGWNNVTPNKSSWLFRHPSTEAFRFYFVHSYFVKCTEESDTVATTNYGLSFTSAFSKNNIHGVQFHPEKSHRFGMIFFQQFIEL